MSGHVIILGAKGRFGRAVTQAFLSAGWDVRLFARSWQGATESAGCSRIAGDAFDAELLTKAADGCDVIINALNPPYPQWTQDLPRFTNSVIKAALSTGATVMIPGNVYNYGARMPSRIDESTPHNPTTRKGCLRVDMEQAYQNAAAKGLRTVMLRAGDFIEREKTGNWFDSYIADKIGKQRAVYPGPLDLDHAWAYLPDMARAMVALAEKRADFADYEEFVFPGYTLTGRQLIDSLERVTGHRLKVGGVPWPLIRFLGLVMPLMREVAEMRYLWRTPHGLDGSKFASVLPEFKATALDAAIADALGATISATTTKATVPDGFQTAI